MWFAEYGETASRFRKSLKQTPAIAESTATSNGSARARRSAKTSKRVQETHCNLTISH
jgi:hypothetical protein